RSSGCAERNRERPARRQNAALVDAASPFGIDGESGAAAWTFSAADQDSRRGRKVVAAGASSRRQSARAGRRTQNRDVVYRQGESSRGALRGAAPACLAR